LTEEKSDSPSGLKKQSTTPVPSPAGRLTAGIPCRPPAGRAAHIHLIDSAGSSGFMGQAIGALAAVETAVS